MTLGHAGAVLAERYQLVRQVGTAIDGEVWQGHDQRLARSVTVRLAAADPDAPVDDPGVQPLITRLSQVNDPGVAAVYDVGVDEGLRYAVGEWIHGRTLGQIFATGRQPWQRAGDWGQQVGTALNSLHEVGIVHGTLTAESIAIQDDRRAKIIDLGLIAQTADGEDDEPADDEDDEATVLSPIGGQSAAEGADADRTRLLPQAERTTVLPPVKAEAPAEASDDVYALGAVLWWAVTGIPLAYATTTSAGPDPAALREVGAPSEFAALVLRMLDPDPQARPSAGAAAEQFAAVQSTPRPDDTIVGPQLIAPTQNIVPPVERTAAADPLPAYEERYRDSDRLPPPTESRRVWAVVAGVLALAVVGVLIGLLLANHHSTSPNVNPSGSLPVPTGTSSDGSVVLPSAPSAAATTNAFGNTAPVATTAPTTAAATTAPAPTTAAAPTTNPASTPPTNPASTPTTNPPTQPADPPPTSDSSLGLPLP
ncbi:MAG TPA: protein kinase [Actinocrinis sp.]|nr:protein kinase [Actinocrinis sp.]